MIIYFTKKITLGPNGSVLGVSTQAPQDIAEDAATSRELGTFDGVTYLYIPEGVNYQINADVEYKQVTDLDTFMTNHPEFSDLNTEVEQNAATEALRAELIAEVKAIGKKFDTELEVKEMYFTSSLGFVCDGDRKSTQNISGLLSGFDIAAAMCVSIYGTDGTVVVFRDRDNVNHQLTKDQVAILNAEIGANGSALYSQKWAQVVALENADKATLKTFTPTFTMSDFSAS